MINKRSRYFSTPTAQTTEASGETVELLELREIPSIPAVFAATVGPGERLDHLAKRYYQDPRRFWKICDAMDELDPFDVAPTGARVLIPPDK